MKIPESWTRVTTLSKILAMLLFIILPFIGFYFGIKYQKLISVSPVALNEQQATPETNKISPTLRPTMIAEITPDPEWSSYIDNDIGISFRYPNRLLIDELDNWIDFYSRSEYQDQKYYQTTLDNIKRGFSPDISRNVWLDKNKPSLPPEAQTMHFNPSVYFKVKRISNKSGLSFMEWLKKVEGSATSPEFPIEKVLGLKKIPMANKEVYFYNGMGIGQGSFNYVFIKSPAEFIVFETMESKKTIENDDTYKAILSSVEYLN